ncbi:MAG: hypothetical protein HOK84_13955 [Bacteroidetes bacterium]|nr:hypothetical protein [Bacteroidota bacterium]
MKRQLGILLAILLMIAPNLLAQNDQELPKPSSFFGFEPGADRELFNYEPLIDYLQILADKSPRVAMTEIGVSPLGLTMYATFLSSEENIRNLDKLKKINQNLALNVKLSDTELAKAVAEGKVFIMAALSMHSGEVGPSQSAPLVAYEVATTTNPLLLEWLDDVVYMMIPCHNPDGMDLVVNHYKKYKGTKYEGGSLPEVYHKYVGHDNNRDFVTLTQSDNQAVAKIYSKTWMPQVMVEKHQMGSTGTRYFVPPMHDPIAVNIDEQIWNWTWIFGSNMSKDMSNLGLAGVAQHYLFDDYWPGSTETALWKNVIGLLTEAASVHYATPVYVEKSELGVYGKGLGEHKKSINLPLPWEGGWWRLSDIVEYELATTWSLIKTAAYHKTEILQYRNDLARKETLKGKSQAPYYYVFPANQKDPGELIALLNLMDQHGIQVYQLEKEVEHNSKLIRKGDFVIPLAQPFRAFIKEVLEKQDFPARHYTPDGELIPPYDITSWSLPLHRGLDILEVNTPNEDLGSHLVQLSMPLDYTVKIPEQISGVLLSAKWNSSYQVTFKALSKGMKVSRVSENGDKYSEGDFVIKLQGLTGKEIEDLLDPLSDNPEYLKSEFSGKSFEIGLPRVGLVETVFHDMDAGWTRYVLDSYDIPFTVLKPSEISAKKLDDFDVIIFPSTDKDLLLKAKYKQSAGVYSVPAYDPKLLKGMEIKGQSELMKYIDEGGVVLSWGESTALFMGLQTINISKNEKEEFQFPVRDISAGLAAKKLKIPGSLLKMELNTDHPLCYGMPETINVFSRGAPVFATSVPYFDLDRRVIGTYPEKDILASGYAENVEVLAEKPAMVWLKKGKGQLVLFGFNPQFRASTSSNYKLLFNGILLK